MVSINFVPLPNTYAQSFIKAIQNPVMDFLSTDFQSHFQKPGQAALQAPPATFCLQSSTCKKITEHLQETRVEENMFTRISAGYGCRSGIQNRSRNSEKQAPILQPRHAKVSLILNPSKFCRMGLLRSVSPFRAHVIWASFSLWSKAGSTQGLALGNLFCTDSLNLLHCRCNHWSKINV